MALMETRERIEMRCPRCELNQFLAVSGVCRRCGHPLNLGLVESTTVILIGGIDVTGCRPVRPMREVMQRTVVDAVRSMGATTKAAKALGIRHSALKQLLRESGDITDYRKDRKKRKQGLS